MRGPIAALHDRLHRPERDATHRDIVELLTAWRIETDRAALRRRRAAFDRQVVGLFGAFHASWSKAIDDVAQPNDERVLSQHDQADLQDQVLQAGLGMQAACVDRVREGGGIRHHLLHVLAVLVRKAHGASNHERRDGSQL